MRYLKLISIVIVISGELGQQAFAERRDSVVFRDDFNGSLASEWHWINEDADFWSLSQRPGYLRIIGNGSTPHDSNIHNMLMQPAPSGDYRILCRIDQCSCAGIMLYKDRNNFAYFCVGNGMYYYYYVNGQILGWYENYMVQKDYFGFERDVTGNTWPLIGDAASDMAVGICSLLPWTSDSNLQIGLYAAGSGDFDFCKRTLSLPSITITSPNGGERLPDGPYTAAITWNSVKYLGDFRIDICRNYPVGDWETITNSTPNTGTYTWPIIGPTCTTARIRITSPTASVISDTSNADFSIVPGPITITSPNGGEQWAEGETRNITWFSGSGISSVAIDLYSRPNELTIWVAHITSSTPNTGTYTWAIPSGLPYWVSRDLYSVWVGSLDDARGDQSDQTFTISTNPINVAAPNGGEIWRPGETHNVTWTSAGCCANVKIDLYRGSPPHGAYLQAIVASTPNDSAYEWMIPTSLNPASGYYVRVADLDDSPEDFSNEPFAIECPPGSISGTVRDIYGDPIGEALVTRIRNGDVLGRRTDASGHFTFENLSAGSYTLQVSHYRYNLTGSSSLTVNLSCGENATRQFQMTENTDVPEIDTVVVRQTLDVHQDPLVAGKTTVVIARLKRPQHDIYGVSGSCWMYVNNVVRGPVIWNETQTGYGRIVDKHWPSVSDTEQWRDALYFRVDGIPECDNVRFEVQVAHYDENVGATKWSATRRFVWSQPLTLHFVPLWVPGWLQVTDSQVDQYSAAVLPRLNAMLPYTGTKVHPDLIHEQLLVPFPFS